MSKSLANKIILVTGSTDGLGKLIAQHLAQQEATVLVHGRDIQKGKKITDELSLLSRNDKLKYYNGDFSSLTQVKDLAEKISQDFPHIDILINNVGIGGEMSKGNRRQLSEDGIELRFAVNYLAHVLLTEKLLPVLPENSSIINVASVGQEPLNFENLMLEERYDGFFAYKQSKTAMIMYTIDLAERLKDKSIKVNAIHPASLMNTKIVLEDWGYSLTTVEQGAEAVESLLSVDTTGAYYDGKRLAKPIAQADDLAVRSRLKDVTWKLLEGYL